jgi:glycosyltransferase involved in cell wall biosynthesis
MNVLVLSSQAINTGSSLRGFYIYKSLKKAGVKASYIPPPFKSMPFMIDFGLSMIYYFFALMNRNYDAVIIIKPYPNTVLPAMMLKSRGAKIIIDVDDLDHGYRRGLISAAVEKMQKSLVKKGDILTTHNTGLMKLLAAQNPDFKGKIYMLKQCVDILLFRADPAKVSSTVKRYAGKKILFYTAHLNIASYLGDILKAVSLLKRDDVVLVIAGGGPMEGYYKKIAKKFGLEDKTMFLGQLPQEEIAVLMAAADVCLVYYENVAVNRYRASMKLREYLLAGNKTAATLVGEIKDFQKFVFGSLASPSSFACAINSALKSRRKPTKARRFIKKEYSWDREAVLFKKYLKSSFYI